MQTDDFLHLSMQSIALRRFDEAEGSADITMDGSTTKP
jgi:hypothetical protein